MFCSPWIRTSQLEPQMEEKYKWENFWVKIKTKQQIKWKPCTQGKVSIIHCSPWTCRCLPIPGKAEFNHVTVIREYKLSHQKFPFFFCFFQLYMVSITPYGLEYPCGQCQLSWLCFLTTSSVPQACLPVAWRAEKPLAQCKPCSVVTKLSMI